MNRATTPGPSAVALAIAGAASVATAFGMARYGYGLLLPEIKRDMALGATAVGAVGTAGYAAYMVATALIPRLVAHAGARAVVVVGGSFAIVGTIIVASAHGPLALVAGVCVAGASAGLVYPPFGDAVQDLPEAVRARTLATISCGTGWGVAVAAPIAIVAADSWRLAYLGFAACAALSTTLAARTMPRRVVSAPPPRPAIAGGSRDRADHPLLIAAMLVGLGSAAYWTFAVDQTRDAGLGQTAGRLMLGLAGLASLLAIGAADVVKRFGAGRTFAVAAVLEAAAVATTGLVAGCLPAVLVAAATFGASYNVLVAVTVMWAVQLHPDRAATGVAAACAANGAGLMCGPLLGGIVAEAVGLTSALVGGGALLLGAAVFAPRGELRPRRSIDRTRSVPTSPAGASSERSVTTLADR